MSKTSFFLVIVYCGRERDRQGCEHRGDGKGSRKPLKPGMTLEQILFERVEHDKELKDHQREPRGQVIDEPAPVIIEKGRLRIEKDEDVHLS